MDTNLAIVLQSIETNSAYYSKLYWNFCSDSMMCRADSQKINSNKPNMWIKRITHLTSQEISAYVDAHYHKELHTLPIEKVRHIWKCKRCEQQIINVYHTRYQSFPMNIGKTMDGTNTVP